MTDLDDIRARHVPVTVKPFTSPEKFCQACKFPWPCDAHQLGVALEEARTVATEALAGRTSAIEGREAAEAREQRLRAAAELMLACVTQDEMVEGFRALRAALAAFDE